MGFIDESEVQNVGTVQSAQRVVSPLPERTPVAKAVSEPNDSSLLGAAFRQQNVAVNAYQAAEQYLISDKLDRTFNPRRQAREDGMGEYLDRFNTVTNREQYDYLKGKIKRELQDRQRLEEANGVVSFLAQGFAAVADPVNIALAFIPGGAYVRGAGFVKNFARTALVGGLEGAATEVPLYKMQETRTVNETAGNIAGSALGHSVLGGLLGRAGDKVPKDVKGKLANDITSTLERVENPMADLSSAVVRNMPAAADGTLLQKNAATKVADAIVPDFMKGVGQKTADSEFQIIREFGQKLGIDNLRREGVAEHSAELLKKWEEKDVIGYAKASKDMYAKLDSLGELSPQQKLDVARQLQELGYKVDDFEHITPDVVRRHAQELVGYAARNGYDHVIPQIAGAAKALGRIFEADLKRSIDLGLIKPEDAEVLGASTYFTRVFNKQKIDQNQKEFVDTLTKPIAERLMKDGEDQATALYLAEGIARSIKDKLIHAEGHPVYATAVRDVLNQKGYGKLTERTLDVPDAVLAPFLENNAAKVLTTYKRSTAPQRALKEATGFTRWEDFRANVLDPEWRVLESNDKAVSDAWKSDVEKLQVLWERVSGTRSPAPIVSGAAGEAISKAGRIARGLSRPVYLGGAAISSIVDAASMVLHQGFAPVMKGWAKTLASKEVRNMSKENAHRVGAAAELVMMRQNRVMREAIGEGIETQFAYADAGKFEQGIADFNELFSYITGQTGWNDVTRSLAVTLNQDRILRAAEQGWSKLAPKDVEYMKVMGIDEAMLDRIGKAASAFTEDVNGLKATDVSMWTDDEAAKFFDLASLKAATTELATPTAGTLPSWADAEAGKWLMQFKSFIWAHYQQTLYAGLQKADADAAMAMVTALALGMSVAEFQQVASGRNEKRTWDERLWAGMDKSGILSLPMEVYSQADVLTRLASEGDLYLRPYQNQKYRDASVGQVIGGPAGALLGKAFDVVKDGVSDVAETGAVSDKTQNRAVSMLPGQNLFYFRPWLAALEFTKGQTEYIDRISEAFDNAFPEGYGETADD